MRLALFSVLILLGAAAEARVFSFKSYWAAAHIEGTGGFTAQSGEAYSGTSGTDTGFSDDVKYDFSGEFGFTFLLSERLSMRFGVQGVQSKSISAAGNSIANSSNYMSVSSQAVVFNPNLTFETTFTNNGATRLFGFFGAGYAMAKIDNSYSLTSAGTTKYSGAPATFSNEWKGTTISADAGFGSEFYVFDNVTISLLGGYRYMDFTSLTYAGADGGFSGGSYVAALTSGGAVKDNIGGSVHVDMSGLYAGLLIRFFIPPLN